MEKIIGYKGFGKDFKCRDKQYKVGKTYKESTATICESGMHFCTIPFDVFKYYAPNTENHFALVEAYADCPKSNDDSKRCTTKLKIVKELSPKEMIEEQAKFSSNFVTMGYQSHSATTGDYSHSATTGRQSHSATTGYQSHSATTGYQSHSATTGRQSHSATTGYQSHSATTGDYSHSATTGRQSHSTTTGDQSHSATTGRQSHSATTGDYSHSTTTGRQSIAAALGINSSAAAALNEWIVLADWRKDPDGNYKLHGGKWLKVDGEKIKPNVFYTLVNGEPVEATVD